VKTPQHALTTPFYAFLPTTLPTYTPATMPPCLQFCGRAVCYLQNAAPYRCPTLHTPTTRASLACAARSTTLAHYTHPNHPHPDPSTFSRFLYAATPSCRHARFTDLPAACYLAPRPLTVFMPAMRWRQHLYLPNVVGGCAAYACLGAFYLSTKWFVPDYGVARTYLPSAALPQQAR